MRRERNLTALCFTVALMAALGTARAWADAWVSVRISGFSPTSVSINVGETVYFVVADDNGPYCVQSTIGAWTPWYLFDNGDGFGITINERGDYYYRDTFTGHTGVIHVGTGSVNVPPSVTITSPAEWEVFTEPAAFTFSATVTDSDNGVAAVEFYVEANLIDTLYTGPFSTQVTNLAAGSYTLTVVARDTASATATASVQITVLPSTTPTISMSSPRVVAGQFQFEAAGLTVGKQVVLEATTNPGSSGTWTPLETNVVASATVTFSTPALPGCRLFRLLQLP
ncbi:MAG TPA: Ig-like domain-containing protein [Verrucomicrobiae bacterium]